MNKLKRIMAALCVCFFAFVNVFAQDSDNTIPPEANENDFMDDNESENDLFEDDDNEDSENDGGSDNNENDDEDDDDDEIDPYVQVIREVNGLSTTVYTGYLSGYCNGAWSGIDFSEVNFVVIFEWDSINDDVIYIFPIEQDELSGHTNMEDEMSQQSMFSLLNMENIQPNLEISVSYCVNNIEITDDEIDLEGGDVISAEYTIENMSTSSENVELIICLYNSFGVLSDIETVQEEIVAGQTVVVDNDYIVPDDGNSYYVKIFLWNGLNGLRPLWGVKQIGQAEEPQTIITADINCVLDKEYNLVLTASDIPINDNGTYTVSYDPDKIELIDLCSLTYVKELSIGEINGTNINIIDFDPVAGTIQFANPNESNLTSSKVLNSLKFKGLVSEQQAIVTIQ